MSVLTFTITSSKTAQSAFALTPVPTNYISPTITNTDYGIAWLVI